MPEFTHFTADGLPHMVDVGAKDETRREAVAEGIIVMQPETLQRIVHRDLLKGDVFTVAELAGIMGAKETSRLIPLAHNIPLTGVELRIVAEEPTNSLHITASVRCTGRTGAEMEALTAVSVAALTVYDMCKAVDRSMEIRQVRLVAKSGGKSGEYRREAGE